EKVVLAAFANVGLDAFEAIALDTAGEGGVRIDSVSGEILGTALADRTVAFERESDRIEARVARGAGRVLAMLGEHVPQRQIHLGFGVRQLGHDGRWWRNHFAEYASHDPITTLDRAGAQTRSILREERRHRQDAAAAVLPGVIDAHPIVRTA